MDGVPWDFTQQLLPAEWELFEPLMTGALRRCPILDRAEIVQLVNGPDGFTPDGHYALGPVPGVPGFYVAAGMSINGIAGAGGVGRVMAEWILEGEPSLDLAELNVRRFGRHLADRGYVMEIGRITTADSVANLLASSQVREAYLGRRSAPESARSARTSRPDPQP